MIESAANEEESGSEGSGHEDGESGSNQMFKRRIRSNNNLLVTAPIQASCGESSMLSDSDGEFSKQPSEDPTNSSNKLLNSGERILK